MKPEFVSTLHSVSRPVAVLLAPNAFGSGAVHLLVVKLNFHLSTRSLDENPLSATKAPRHKEKEEKK